MTGVDEPLVEAASQKILIVDDEPHIISAIQDLFEDDFAVLGITDARVALNLLEEQNVSVIISDQRMPGLSGDQFLREAQKHSQAPRILITGYTDLSALVQAVNEGHIYGYVAKPWDPERLKELVSKAAKHFQLAQDLERERMLMRTLMDHVPDVIYFKDTASRFTRINRAQAQELGIGDPIEAVGKTDFDFLGRAFALKSYAEEQQLMETGQPLIDKVERVINPDRRIRWFSTTKVPIIDWTGEVSGIIGLSRDITERKQLEEQLLQAQKLEAIGRLAAGVAHDFNNLLTVITGYTGLILQRLSLADPHRANLQEIGKAADRGAGLIRQLLAFSRKQIMEPRVLDLNTVIRGLEKILGRLIHENVELNIKLAADLGQIRADQNQLEQIVINLAVNARDAMPQGGLFVIETRNLDLDETYTSVHQPIDPGPYVLLEVSDTGVGMDADIRAHLFEPFFTTKEPGKGTGLGLATVYGIVKQSGGHILVYSEVGKGTTFKIYLPRVREVPEPAVRETAARAPRGTEHLLLVEDEQALREMIAVALREAGYRVVEASCGDEAQQYSAQHQGKIHLVITDMVMPGMGGRELGEQLMAASPYQKILYMSGYSAEIVERQGVLEPGMHFLQKPFDILTLLSKVRSVLDKDS